MRCPWMQNSEEIELFKERVSVLQLSEFLDPFWECPLVQCLSMLVDVGNGAIKKV